MNPIPDVQLRIRELVHVYQRRGLSPEVAGWIVDSLVHDWSTAGDQAEVVTLLLLYRAGRLRQQGRAEIAEVFVDTAIAAALAWGDGVRIATLIADLTDLPDGVEPDRHRV